MSMNRKLKPDRSIGGWLAPLVLILGFGLTTLIFDIASGIRFFCIAFGLFAVYNLVIFIRTGNTGHLVACAFDAFTAIMAIFEAQYVEARQQIRNEWMIAWISGLAFFGVLLIFLTFTKRIKWRGREIFELAAEALEESGNGYTSRPRPAGHVEFGKTEIQAFARFCSRHLIALPYTNAEQVCLVPVRMGQEYAFLFWKASDMEQTTWITFTFDGTVSVHIAHKDYLDYIDPPNFDRLCQSLGDLFIEFAGMHQRGEGTRIIDRLDALQLNYFT